MSPIGCLNLNYSSLVSNENRKKSLKKVLNDERDERNIPRTISLKIEIITKCYSKHKYQKLITGISNKDSDI